MMRRMGKVVDPLDRSTYGLAQIAADHTEAPADELERLR